MIIKDIFYFVEVFIGILHHIKKTIMSGDAVSQG